MKSLVLLLLLAAGAAYADKHSFEPDAIYRVPIGMAPVEGPANAPITIVEWSDYTCGYCNRVQHTLDGLARLYPGQIRWVHRTLPLDYENTLASEAALAAAAQGKYRAMNDRLFAVGGRVDRPAIELIGRELGLDMVRLRADLDTHAHVAQIKADIADAMALGVTGTPTFFVNGRAVHGSQPLRLFAAVVDEELARAAREGPLPYEERVVKGRPKADGPAEPRRAAFELDENGVYRVGLGLPGHQSGPDDALVTIVVWSDFQCPFCKRVVPALEHARAKYGNDVRVVYRHLAMAMHRHAQLAAEAAVAAAEQGKFWAYHDQIFASFGKLTRADLEGFAQAVGLDMTKFRAALDDRRYRDAVFAESADALALGIDGTPTMFINGAPVGGSRDSATLDGLIDTQLERARDAARAGTAPSDMYAHAMSAGQGVERADPASVPTHAAVRGDELVGAVAAACRRRDGSRARELAGPLAGDAKKRALLVCGAVGIDLP